MISEKDVIKLAGLANIDIDEKESAEFASKVDSILEYMNKLSSINTEDVQPLSHVHGIINVFREDTVQISIKSEDALKNAPDTSGRFIKVPLVIN